MDYLWRRASGSDQKVTWAASLGDRSENADYQYNKSACGDRSPGPLSTKCLEQLKIVDYSPQQEGKVFFGARVEIENDEGDIKRFRIVGYDEILAAKTISPSTRRWRALLKRGWRSGHRQHAGGRSQLVCQRDRIR